MMNNLDLWHITLTHGHWVWMLTNESGIFIGRTRD